MSDQRDTRDDLRLAYNECERYAGKLERALEQIADVVHLALRIEELGASRERLALDVRRALGLVEGLAQVKDDRKKIYAEKQG